MRRLCVLLVEDSTLFRSALTSFLQELGLSVLTSAADPRRRNERGRADVVLVDLGTYTQSVQAVEQLVRELSEIAPVLLLAREDHIEHLVAGLKAGAMGFIEPSASISELEHAILALSQGSTWCDAKAFQKVMKFLPVLECSHPLSFTKREEEVLGHVSLGASNKEIAQRLGLSEQSVKVYVSNLLRKTGAPSRSGLALYAVALGLEREQTTISKTSGGA